MGFHLQIQFKIRFHIHIIYSYIIKPWKYNFLIQTHEFYSYLIDYYLQINFGEIISYYIFFHVIYKKCPFML